MAGSGALTDWISLGVLASAVPRDAVDDAIAETGKGALRAGGKLPPHVMVYFVMALALFAAAGTAYWKAYRGLQRALFASLFFAGFPALVALAGYLPMSKLGQGDDVPGGVAREWARWARDPRYVFVRKP